MENFEQDLDFSAREVVLRADFEDADLDRCLWTSMRFLVQGPRHPRVGEDVYLINNDGGGCLGRVIELNGWMARVRMRSADA
jgi:hypothetical protein